MKVVLLQVYQLWGVTGLRSCLAIVYCSFPILNMPVKL